MSGGGFFDEVETNVANTRFLQAIEDNQIIKFVLKDYSTLTQLEVIDHYRTVNGDQRLLLARTFLSTHPIIARTASNAAASTSSAASAAPSSIPTGAALYVQKVRSTSPSKRSSPNGSTSSAAPPAIAMTSVVPAALLSSSSPSPTPAAPPSNRGSIVARASIFSSSKDSVATAAALHAATYPCMTQILMTPVVDHACCAALSDVDLSGRWAAKLGAWMRSIGYSSPSSSDEPPPSPSHATNDSSSSHPSPCVELFDELYSSLILHLYTFGLVGSFLNSPAYAKYVQLLDHCTRLVGLEQFRVFRTIGRGAFGAVSAVQKLDARAVYAMKEMSKRQIKHDNSLDNVLNEKWVLSQMSSRFVLGLNYSFQDLDNLYFVFEMCVGGDLKFHLSQSPLDGGRFDPARAQFYAAEILLGLEHLHSKNIVYRDLKPNNILLGSSGHVIISDLGLAVLIRPGKVLRQAAGTSGYWAPEIMSKRGTFKTSDFWSWAVMLYEMLTGKKPACTCNGGRRDSNKTDAGKKKEWCTFSLKRSHEEYCLSDENEYKSDIPYPPQFISASAKDLLEKLFNPDPLTRLGVSSSDDSNDGIDAIKSHPYFAGLDWSALSRSDLPPPFVPENRTVYTNSIGEVGEFNSDEVRHVNLTDDDQREYDGFDFISREATEGETVDALAKCDDPESLNNQAKAKGKGGEESTDDCCVIL